MNNLWRDIRYALRQLRKTKEIMEMFRALNRQGTTIVEVTHSYANAAYGTRTLELRDGWMTMDSKHPKLATVGSGGRS